MAWMLVNPQICKTFSSLGVQQGDAYKVNEDCLAILGEILHKLVVEDRTLRTFRRAVGFGQHIRKDLLPLLINVKDDTRITDASKIIDVTIKILVNLTIPVECLISTDALSRTTNGRHTIFEINKLLVSSKEAFVDSRSTKAVLDHIKFVVEKGTTLEVEQCDSINNCLLLLRNILHVPEARSQIANCTLAHSSTQNQILWNIFTQSIDKLLIHLMSCPQKVYWVVTMVQLISLMYKDQHVRTLQKLLNLWFEASLSDSSDDNESNTSPPNQDSGNSSPMLTSDPTSDSSDNGTGGKTNSNRCKANEAVIKQHVVRSTQSRNKILLTSQKYSSQSLSRMSDLESSNSSHTTDSKREDFECQYDPAVSHIHSMTRAPKRKLEHTINWSCQSLPPGAIISPSPTLTNPNAGIKKQDSLQSEFSDYGYGTQVENQESISTSSNDDDVPTKKMVHQKPHLVQKPRYAAKQRSPQDKKEDRRKKLVKRSKTHIINMKGLLHHSPTNENISNILKEFTVDFLLKGYGSLVQDLYSQLLSNTHIQIDTSHFFWLVTYFLKFATQLELDFDHISPVLSINIISYLTFEGISLCEQLGVNSGPIDVEALKPCLRRTHLVITAIREFLHAIESYKKITHLTNEDQQNLTKLQLQIASTENFKSLFLLLLRQYNPKLQSKQYLQDLVTTNHILILFLENVSKLPEYKDNGQMMSHLKQFATVEVMHKYGILLEEFESNGKFVNDCIFTMMHHVGGDLDNVAALFQPQILKTFSKIWESEYEICNDWSDLIEYVIHKFINVPRSTEIISATIPIQQPLESDSLSNVEQDKETDEWSQENQDVLYWFFVESRQSENMIENIIRSYEEDGVTNKTKTGVIKQLLKQNIITKDEYEKLIRNRENSDKSTGDDNTESHEIKLLKDQLVKENLGNSILWLQQILIEACYCKIVISHRELFQNSDEIMEPVPYCYSMLNQSIPLVPWNEEQWSLLNEQPFILLLHKLGFHLPADTGKLFVRIPNFWTADYMYSIAQKLGPIDSASLKFDVKLLHVVEETEEVHPEYPCAVTNYIAVPPQVQGTTPITPYVQSLTATSTSWYHNVLQSRPTSLLNVPREVPSVEVPLVVIIPDIKCHPCDLPVPTISGTHEIHDNVKIQLPVNSLQCIKVLDMVLDVNEDCDHNSMCETASIDSDLTRMYVSDGEDKEDL